MNIFSRLSIKFRIYLLFAAGVVTLISISVYSIFAIDNLSETIQKMYDHPFTVTKNILAAGDDVKSIHRDMKDYLYVKTDLDRGQILESIQQHSESAQEHLSMVEERILGEKGMQLIKELKYRFDNWQPIRKEIMNLVEEGQQDKAISLAYSRGDEHVFMLERRFVALKEYAQEKAEAFVEDAQSVQSSTLNFLVWSSLIIVIASIVLALMITRSITKPLSTVNAYLKEMRMGKQPEVAKMQGKDELAEINTSIGEVVEGLGDTADFARRIGEGQLDSDFEALSDDDILGNALLQMRARISEVNDQEQQQKWAAEGMTSFGELLRKYQTNLDELANKLIAELTEYLNVNQAALYMITTEYGEQYLEMKACYAWDRLKREMSRQHLEDGLVGQAVIDMKTIHLYNVPEDYITIGSGLGKAVPRQVIIIPLITNEQAEGVLELATFQKFETHQVDFLEDLAVSIAATIHAARVNERTKALLNEAQEKNQQLAAQEEEIRQNAEELQATQEEMTRVSRTQAKRIEKLEQALKSAGINPDDL